MENSLQLGKRTLVLAVAAATILWTLGISAFAPQTAGAVDYAGQVVRGTSLSTVYYVDGDGERHAFPNQKTYNTWYNDFSGVMMISDSALAAISLGSNVMYRPGARWVKVQSVAKTYAVTPQGSLRWIETPAVAEGLAGSAWNTVIDDVPEVFFFDYSIGSSLLTAEAYEGMFVMDGSNKYVVSGGEKRLVTAAGQAANGFQDRFFLSPEDDILSSLSAGADVSAKEGALSDPAQLGGVSTPSTATGDLVVSLSSGSPASMAIPARSTNVEVLEFKLMANGGDATVTELQFHMGGFTAVSEITSAYLYQDGTRLTNGRSVNSSTRNATFGGLSWTIPSGQSKTYQLVLEMDTTLTSGDTFYFSILDAAAVQASGSVGGSFPVQGATMTTSSTQVGTVTIDETGTIENAAVGENGAKIAEFNIQSGSTEGIYVHRLTLDVRSGEDHTNYKLWYANDWLADGVRSGDNVTFNFAEPFFIDEGDDRNLEVTADMGGQNGDEVLVAMEYTTDLYAIGDEYGFGVAVTNNYNETGSANCNATTDECSYSTLEGGQITLADNNYPASDIPIDETGVALFGFSITSQNWSEVRDIDFSLAGSDFTATENNFQNFRLVNLATGTTLMGPSEFDTAGLTATAGTVSFTDDFVMNAGDSLDLELRVDVKGSTGNFDVADGDTVTVTLTNATTFSARDANNDDLTVGTDIIPATNIVGNQMTLEASSLDVNLSQPPAAGTFVKGTKNVDIAGFAFTAGDASDIEMSAITLLGRTDNATHTTFSDDGGDPRDKMSSCSLVDSSSGAVVKGPKSFAASATASAAANIVFSGFSWTVPKGETKRLLVRCDLANVDLTSSNTDAVAVMIDAAADLTARDEDGDSVTPTSGGATFTNVNGAAATNPTVYQTIDANGTLTVAAAGDTPNVEIVLGDSTGVVVSKYKFTTANEAQLVKKIMLENTSLTDAAVSAVYVSYKNQAGETVTHTGFLSGNSVTFSAMTFYVPANNSAYLTVSVDTNEVSTTGATSGNTFRLSFDGDGATEFESVGLGSGETLDGTHAGVADVAGSVMTLRKTKPTISLASGSPAGASIPSLIDVLYFNVAADSRGEVTLDAILFDMNSTANASASVWNQCGTSTTAGYCTGSQLANSDFSFYDMAENNTALDTTAETASTSDWLLLESDGSTAEAADVIEYALLDLPSDEEIAAGTTKTFRLSFDATGASSVSDDTLRFDIPDEAEADALTTARNAIEWEDANTAVTDIVGTSVDNLPINGGALLF